MKRRLTLAKRKVVWRASLLPIIGRPVRYLRGWSILRQVLRQEREEPFWGRGGPQATVPPEDERLAMRAVWAVEVYTPLHIRELARRLERLGFRRDRYFGSGGIVEDLLSARWNPYGGSWMNLDHVFPPDVTILPGMGVKAPLPAGVRCVRPSIHALTPSIAVVVAQFVLDDEAGLAADKPARKTEFEPRGRVTASGGASTVPQMMVKQESVREAQRELRERGAKWMRENLPGAFASALGRAEMPTAELMTTEVLVPFARVERDEVEYVDYTGLAWEPDSWTTPSLPGWTLVLAQDEAVFRIAGRRSDVLAESDVDPYRHARLEEDETWGLTRVLNDHTQVDIALWGAWRFLRAHHARVAQIRDGGVGGSTSMVSASRRLKRVRGELLRDLLDARVAAVELGRLAEDRRSFGSRALDWIGSDYIPSRTDEKRLFVESLRREVAADSAALEGSEQRLRDSLLVDTTVVSTLTNLRLQVRLFFLTILATGVAVFSLIYAMRHNHSDNPPPTTSTTTGAHQPSGSRPRSRP